MGRSDDIETFVQDRVDLALAFEPHYMERENGQWPMDFSVEGSPLPRAAGSPVYTDITATKRAEEALLRARSEELSENSCSAMQRTSRPPTASLEATVTALEEAKRQLTAAEARTRLTTPK